MKMVIWILMILGVATTAGADGGHDDIGELYGARNFAAVVDSCRARLADDPEDRALNHYLGRALYDMGRRLEAEAYLRPIVESGIKDWRYAWSLFYLGGIALERGDDDAAVAAWREVRDGGLTRNVARNADRNLSFFALHEDFDDWARRQTEHFRFAFSPGHADKDLDAYAAEHEAAYAELVEFFGGEPSGPVRYIVWDSLEEATAACGIKMLGFSRPSYRLVHCMWPQTLGHELTHVLSHQARNPVAKTRLVNEGLAVCLDMTGRDRLALARARLVEAGIEHLDLLAWWSDGRAVEDAVFYPVAGAWIDTLLDRGGREKLLALATDQTLESARTIYGDDLDAYMSDFTATLFPDGTR